MYLLTLIIIEKLKRFLSKGGKPEEFTYAYPYSMSSLEKLEKNVQGLGSISFLDQLDYY